ncbi:hypothetical protein MKC91_04995 [[Clostridium] innocuum]|nr:hypothetical protein [Erysipelotrichaceae bacterium]MCR0384377.1 hypothetical protein [[Clostridium] innocuum]MCR0535041.1 hypothetical protein [[Clostridium] innocuum]MCR0537751.1 hypothetical protein [[Clostridium] innocuum]MDU1120590.1 hypothetical protein [Erysipelotrichaceae bacterium]
MKEWGILHSHNHRIYESSCIPPCRRITFYHDAISSTDYFKFLYSAT